MALARDDVAGYLRRMAGGPLATDAASARLVVRASTDPSLAALTGAPSERGFKIARVDDGGRTVLAVHAASDAALVHGLYALLEELGARFFHPEQELIPELGALHIPRQLAIGRDPAFAVRGVQLHLLHPTEYFASFNEPGEQHLAEAKRFIDWLVKTGQNHVQWWLLETMDWEAWLPHGRAIVDYAHSRGVTAGAVVQLWGGSSLQHAIHLVDDEARWQTEIPAGIDALMAIPWDVIEVGLGEFLSGDPQALLDWMNLATDHVATRWPGTDFTVINHVGNYENLWIDWKGERTFFYHLPGEADPRLVNTVHTLFFFDLYRPWAMYEHPDFSLQREFIQREVGERRVRYQPESAYWVTADVDVPAFLPEYLLARWTDIHGLHRDLTLAGKPSLEGHVMFSSGHEWGYWLTDYLSAKMMWEPEQPLERFLAHYGGGYGACGDEIGGTLGALVDHQTRWLFDARLVPYVSGEDATDDAGYLIGIETHPPRVPFQQLHAWSEPERATFEHDVLDALAEAVRELTPIRERFARTCGRVDETLAPWCAELVDGTEIVELRLQHSEALYRGVLASARGGDAAPHFARAASLRDDAREVVARREPHYRFPLGRLVESYQNPTSYEHGYLRQAHTLCFWERQQEQASYVVEYGVGPALTAMQLTCQQ